MHIFTHASTKCERKLTGVCRIKGFTIEHNTLSKYLLIYKENMHVFSFIEYKYYNP